MSRLAFLAREALTNLRRNVLVATGAVLAVFISLTLAFGALVVNELLRVNTLAWQSGVHVIAFLSDEGKDGVPSDAHEIFLAEVQGWPEVKSTIYYDKAAAWEEYKQIFASQPEMIDGIDPSILPASIRIELLDIDLYRDVRFRLAQQPQLVRKVSTFGDAIDQLSSLSRVLNFLGLGLALVLGLSAVILIANTIRMAIYARRDEVSIMKLVGAGNWFIRVPFLLEGLIEGMVGAGLAVLTVWIASVNLRSIDETIELISLAVSDRFFLRWGILFLVFGAAAGVLGSLLGLSRYLREADGGRPIGLRRTVEGP
jgi:cell division transport system permease protein